MFSNNWQNKQNLASDNKYSIKDCKEFVKIAANLGSG